MRPPAVCALLPCAPSCILSDCILSDCSVGLSHSVDCGLRLRNLRSAAVPSFCLALLESLFLSSCVTSPTSHWRRARAWRPACRDSSPVPRRHSSQP